MSRVGKKPIPIPAGVKAVLAGGVITIEGPKGKMTQEVKNDISVEMADNQIVLKRPSDSNSHKASHGLYRALIANMIIGVTKGYTKELEIEGVGYKAEPTGKGVTFALGYSHPICVIPPAGVKIDVQAPTKFSVSGINKHIVGQLAAKIRSLRPPEPYQGKGIRYAGEQIRRKAGKQAGA
jgi:large subunit ribosomal protein L6